MWLPTQYFALLTCRKIFFKMNKNAALSNLRNEILKRYTNWEKKSWGGGTVVGWKKSCEKRKAKKGSDVEDFFSFVRSSACLNVWFMFCIKKNAIFFFCEILGHLQTTSSNTKSKSFGSKIFAITSFAINFAFSFTQIWWIHTFVTQVTSKTPLVPCFSSSTHQLSNENLQKLL